MQSCKPVKWEIREKIFLYRVVFQERALHAFLYERWDTVTVQLWAFIYNQPSYGVILGLISGARGKFGSHFEGNA